MVGAAACPRPAYVAPIATLRYTLPCCIIGIQRHALFRLFVCWSLGIPRGYPQGEGKSEEASELNLFVPYFASSLQAPAVEIEERMYRGQSGMLSWLLHRITGLGVLLFLLIHIVDVSLLGFGPHVYDEGIALFDSVIVRILSLFLIGAVLLHAFNGVRIMVIDFWRKGVRYQLAMFVIALVLTIGGFVPIAYFILAPVFLHPHATTIAK